MRIWPQVRTAPIELSDQVSGSLAESSDRPNVNRDAFGVFYSRTNRLLWAYLFRTSGRPDVADDLLQESYCRFLAAELPEMDAAESRSYLFRIATNLLHDCWRDKQVSEVVGPADQSREDDPEMRADVRRCFERLKSLGRQLLW